MADECRNMVFAYDTQQRDAVWLRFGGNAHSPWQNLVQDEEVEVAWPLPETPTSLAEFVKKWRFERITTLEAQEALRQYIQLMVDNLLDPVAMKEVLADPSKSIQFVRAVKNFMMDVEEIA